MPFQFGSLVHHDVQRIYFEICDVFPRDWAFQDFSTVFDVRRFWHILAHFMCQMPGFVEAGGSREPKEDIGFRRTGA